MFEISVTKLSSKGQIVIPKEMRVGFKPGKKFVVIKSGNKFILKSVSDFDKNVREELRFAENTEKALKKYEKGKFKKMTKEEFIKELDKW